MALPLAAAAAAGLATGLGSYFGAQKQADAAREAARLQAAAAREALQWNKDVYNQASGQYNPYIQVGQVGLTGYQDAIQNFAQPTMDYQQKDFNLSNWKDPGYDYRLAEANRAIEASTAGKGMTLGSGALRALQTRNQDMASQEYQNAYNRYNQDSTMRYGQASDQYDRDYNYGNQNLTNYQNLSTMGQNAIAGLGNIGVGQSTDISDLYGNIGATAATAANAQGQANAAGWSNLGTGLGDFIKNYYETKDIKDIT